MSEFQKVRDYHDFTTIDTCKEERYRLYVGEIYENGCTCLKCNTYIRSRNKHDYVSCPCGSVSVDGGSHYIKRNGDASLMKNNIVLFKDVEDERV